MSKIGLYLDEDAMHSRLVAALRFRSIPVITVLDAGLAERTDEEQLVFATERECVLYTFNVSDFHRLHTKFSGAGREHAGMILAPQQRYSVGEQLRRILRLRASMSAESMRNQAEFLSNWGSRTLSSIGSGG